MWTLVQRMKEIFTQTYADDCPLHQAEKKNTYVMYVYVCNAILTTSTKNRSEEEMIRDFTGLTEDLKFRGINPGFHFMDNE